ncbi:MAG: hypothetical protein J6B30_04820 [Muribaculaceae bacterium]|nr:hypothetical protein [Muribaculaceae bacterium]
MKDDKTKQKSKKKRSVFWRIIHGQLLTIEFFVRHWLKIAVLMVMILVYISNKYQCQTSMVRIKNLERDLEIVKNQCITERGLYMGRTRESAMQELVDSLHLDLKKQQQPPFIISYSE